MCYCYQPPDTSTWLHRFTASPLSHLPTNPSDYSLYVSDSHASLPSLHCTSLFHLITPAPPVSFCGCLSHAYPFTFLSLHFPQSCNTSLFIPCLISTCPFLSLFPIFPYILRVVSVPSSYRFPSLFPSILLYLFCVSSVNQFPSFSPFGLTP